MSEGTPLDRERTPCSTTSFGGDSFFRQTGHSAPAFKAPKYKSPWKCNMCTLKLTLRDGSSLRHMAAVLAHEENQGECHLPGDGRCKGILDQVAVFFSSFFLPSSQSGGFSQFLSGLPLSQSVPWMLDAIKAL